jgi:phage tail sheath protein FI
MKALIDTNQSIRDNDTLGFNLLATPGYPEVIQNMIGLNTDRGITAFVVGDTPMRLEPTGTALNAWGLNTAEALDNGDTGATSYDEYMAMYYPSGYTNDNTGNNIVVPASHMMLRTIINSDAKSYPWFAPAGTRRGGVDNATAVGYITAEGEFKSTALPQNLRDVLDDVKINPIATLTGVGVLAYGQRTRARNASALDRINVARLVCYLRKQLDVLARPFLFEPNDAQTRREIKAAAESLMLELVGQRALYDYVIVCDETNNTPSRIDRNELYVDIAIEPVKAIEYIYIPLRLKNTGDIAAGL